MVILGEVSPTPKNPNDSVRQPRWMAKINIQHISAQTFKTYDGLKTQEELFPASFIALISPL